MSVASRAKRILSHLYRYREISNSPEDRVRWMQELSLREDEQPIGAPLGVRLGGGAGVVFALSKLPGGAEFGSGTGHGASGDGFGSA